MARDPFKKRGQRPQAVEPEVPNAPRGDVDYDGPSQDQQFGRPHRWDDDYEAAPSDTWDEEPVSRYRAPRPESAGVVDEDSAFNGRFNTERDLFVSGEARGEIVCGGTFTIEESGRVWANVRAANAYIVGTFNGELVCDGRVELESQSSTAGKITAGALLVHEGAQITGSIEMGGAGDIGPAEPRTAEPADRAIGRRAAGR